MAGKVIDRDRGFKRLMRNWRRIVASSRRPGGASVTTGIQGPEATEAHDSEKGSITNLVLMIIHEFGVPKLNIPSRSVVRFTADKHKTKYLKMLKAAGLKALRGGSLAQGLFVLGETARSDMILAIQQQQIKQDLAPATMKRRGDTGPALWDEGLLKDAFSSVVHG